jgi:hypothetical protein
MHIEDIYKEVRTSKRKNIPKRSKMLTFVYNKENYSGE